MTYRLVAAALATLVAASPGTPAARSPTLDGEISPRRYAADVRHLASDELEGRGNCTTGLERAAEYIAGELRQAGLEPGGPGGSWHQPFPLAVRLATPERDGDREAHPPAGKREAKTAAHPVELRCTVRNVIGVVPGADPALAHEAVVVGAHYDHLGLGGPHSQEPDAVGQIHNGADDNASGTAALLEMARVVSRHRARFPRATIFVAFAGEEVGLFGSVHYVAHPTVPIERTIAMLNLDMVGRPEGQIIVSGTASAPSLAEDVDAVAADRSVRVHRSELGYGAGSSDDSAFLARGVPAIAFFSGYHGDYHRPTDDWERLDMAGAVEVTRMALALIERISARRERPVLTGR